MAIFALHVICQFVLILMRENKKVKFAAPADITLSGSNEEYFWNIP